MHKKVSFLSFLLPVRVYLEYCSQLFFRPLFLFVMFSVSMTSSDAFVPKNKREYSGDKNILFGDHLMWFECKRFNTAVQLCTVVFGNR